MRKYFALVSVALLVAFAAPALAATNPFMDVPLNHWAYDAIGQLAASGILAGYPDGTYKGKQPTTRYEMASALARALAGLDMTKASKQDVEMLKRLVVEFKDELDALGVRIDQIYDSVMKLNERLAGWRFSGVIRMDIVDFDKGDGDKSAYASMARARLYADRWFGENDEIHFHMRLRDDNGDTDQGAFINKFFVEFPAWAGTKVTVGRFGWQYDMAYYLDFGGPLAGFNDSLFSDITYDGFAIEKTLGLGGVKLAVNRPSRAVVFGEAYEGISFNRPGKDPNDSEKTLDGSVSAWQFTGAANLQFSERFGVDIGADVYLGDDASKATVTGWDSNSGLTTLDLQLKYLYTAFGGIRINFNQNIGLKGLYYYQGTKLDYGTRDATSLDGEYTNDAMGWKGIVDLKQDLFGFTSLWLSYENYEKGFVVAPGGSDGALYLWDVPTYNNANKWDDFGNVLRGDTKIWRVGASQKWNNKWRTWLYAAGHTYADFVSKKAKPGEKTEFGEVQTLQYGVGIEYYYNPSVAFGLSYIASQWDEDLVADQYDNHRIQFRTQVTF